MNHRIRAGQNPEHPISTPFGKWVMGIILLLLLGAIGCGAWWFWQQRLTEQPKEGSPESTRANLLPHAALTAEGSLSAAPDANAGTSFLDAPAKAPENPIEPAPDAAGQLPAAAPNAEAVPQVLMEWLGKENTYAFVQSQGFVPRFVATVDNLTRSKAPTQIWPLNPTAPQFEVQPEAFGDAAQIAPGNAARYAAMVNFAKSMDMAQAAAMYKRNYALFQSAYEDLGYPQEYFNDRLIAVIDHLLQAPEPAQVQVRQREIKGEFPSQQPWVHYEFVDPQLESLSAGQKIMVRLGLNNERAIKSQLRSFRAHVAAQQASQKAAEPTPAQ